ncbi:MAG: ankyrin repeat domain-containing protein, partial [archaeon]|nr:ankyrin repeat domain-containing protein [archaeon]
EAAAAAAEEERQKQEVEAPTLSLSNPLNDLLALLQAESSALAQVQKDIAQLSRQIPSTAPHGGSRTAHAYTLTQSMIYYHATFGQASELAALVDSTALPFAPSPYNQETPLHVASHFGHIDTICVLVEKKCPIDAQDNKGNTPLHRAARNNNRTVVAKLLQLGANPSVKNSDGLSPSQMALCSDPEVKQLLA